MLSMTTMPGFSVASLQVKLSPQLEACHGKDPNLALGKAWNADAAVCEPSITLLVLSGSCKDGGVEATSSLFSFDLEARHLQTNDFKQHGLLELTD